MVLDKPLYKVLCCPAVALWTTEPRMIHCFSEPRIAPASNSQLNLLLRPSGATAVAAVGPGGHPPGGPGGGGGRVANRE